MTAELQEKQEPAKSYPSSELVQKVIDNISPDIAEIDINGVKAAVIFVPKGMEVKSAKTIIDEYKIKPDRRTGTHTVHRVSSFIALFNRFKAPESVVFAEASITDNSINASLTGILDFHPATAVNTEASNGGHKLLYKFPISSMFAKWLKTNGEVMDQEEFAVFLEDHIGEISVASSIEKESMANLSAKFAEPLEILSLARELAIYSNETIEQSYKPSSGERKIKFSVQHKDSNNNEISIPDFFVITVPMFEAGEQQRIIVKLRYRKSSGRIVWFYELYRVDKMLEAAFDQTITEVEAGTEAPLFVGKSA